MTFVTQSVAPPPSIDALRKAHSPSLTCPRNLIARPGQSGACKIVAAGAYLARLNDTSITPPLVAPGLRYFSSSAVRSVITRL